MKKTTRPIALYITILLLLICLISYVVVHNMQNILISDKSEAITEVASQVSENISNELSSQLDTLQTIASLPYFSSKTSMDGIMKILGTVANSNNYIRMGIADLSGNAVTTDNIELFIGDRTYFKKAISGTRNVTANIADKVNNSTNNVVYAVPIYSDNKVSGVLFAVDSINNIMKLTNNMEFMGIKNPLMIISRNGKIIAQSNELKMLENENFFTYIKQQTPQKFYKKMILDLDGSNNKGISQYTFLNTEFLSSFSRINESEDWFMIISIPKGIFMGNTNKALFMAILLQFGSMLLIFIALLYILFINNKRKNDRNKYNEELKTIAFYDRLTLLPNRITIVETLPNWLEDLNKEGKVGAVLLIDINAFKIINSTFGYIIGDLVLQEIAKQLNYIVSDSDTLGRIGGDEFIILRTSQGNDDIIDFANRVIDIFSSPFCVQDITINLSCSIGIVVYNGDSDTHMVNNEEMISKCEFATAKAKKSGISNYFVYDKDLNEEVDWLIRMEYALANSLKNNEMELYFQPQYDCKSKRITGLESLLRWNSKEFGMISPVNFIPIAEKSGLIISLGRFAIDQTFEFAKLLEDHKICVSVNCSAIELFQTDFISYVIERFDYYQLKPYSVALEITETVIMQSFDDITKKLHILNEKGIVIYLDDFGAGYSSLTYLNHLIIDTVKIDKSFIENLETSKTAKNIVEIIINLCKNLNLKVIAEGVETSKQLSILQECGCDYIQGYYISQPLSKDQTLMFLNKVN